MRLVAGLLSLCLLLLAGCGGSGEGASSSASNGTLAVLLTDGLDESEHLFVRLHRVELVAGSDSTVVFDDPAGSAVDLRALRDESGQRLLLVASDAVPRGQYASAVLTLGKRFWVFDKDNPRATEKEFDDSIDAGQGLVRLRVPFDAGLQVGMGRTDLVLDFELAAWTDNGGKTLPVVKPIVGRPAADAARFSEHAYDGTIGGVSGGGLDVQFDLRCRGGTIRVRCGGATHVAQADGGPSPQLRPGARARVVGRFDPQSGQVIAESVSVGDGAVAASAWLVGKAGNLDAGRGTFEVAWRSAGGAPPTQRSVMVTVGDGTLLRGPTGERLQKADFWEALAGADEVRVEGVASEGAVAATTVRALAASVPPMLSIEGLLAAKSDTEWEVRVAGWDGFAGKADDRVAVRPGDACRFVDEEGKPLAREQFLRAAGSEGSPRLVRVLGRFNGTMFVAEQVRGLSAEQSGEQGAARSTRPNEAQR
ncbi:MAG: DUF4382 domain-containing protein [Fimbriimonadaceae bacterium]